MRIPWIPPFKGRMLDVELADAGSLALVRAYQHENGHWEPAPPELRQGRFDPPPGFKSEYAMLYTAVSIEAVAAETRVMYCIDGGSFWSPARARQWQVASYALGRAGLFIPIDGRNKAVFGIERVLEEHPLTMQSLGLELHRRYGHLAHGLCWESFHRDQPGRCYAIWHSRKGHLDLRCLDDRPGLIDDLRWRDFLAQRPFIIERDLPQGAEPACEGAELPVIS